MGYLSAEPKSLVGSLLGKDYQVLEQIGAGGMAVVYLVEHQTLLKRFAVKVLSDEQASNAEARARFTQEAHAASQLDHENIVTISDFGITPDGRPFYVMELLRGQTLMDRLEDGPMSIAEVVAVSVPIARALAHAHAEGVIHRDVKPENVFLVQRSQGRWGVKVLDFGIAKVTTNPALTKMGQALGSPMFMAPEACRGDDVDQRADLYSFGILLYLMLTGRVPFQDESLLKVLQMQVSAPLPPPREVNPELSPELEAVLIRALEKKPEDRYPTMDALLFDLQAALPEGADSVLIQAHYGTAATDTPFPAQSLRMMAAGLSSQRLKVGGKDVSTQLTPHVTIPTAPSTRRNRGGLVVLAALVVGGAAVGYWRFSASRAADNDATIAAAGSPIDTTPAAAVASQEPDVLPPRVVGPAETVAVVDPTPPPAKLVEPEPVKREVRPAVKPEPRVVQKPKTVPEPPSKRVVLAAAKVETGGGSATKLVDTQPAVVKPDPKVAIVTSPVVVPKETTRVEPPAAGSAAPPVVVKPPPVVDVGSLDATPTIASLDVDGPLPNSVVRRGVERALPALRSCYRAAAKAKGTTPAATVSLSFEIDEGSRATNVSARGGANLATLASCAKSAIGLVRTQKAPDVGTANVTVSITFRPT